LEAKLSLRISELDKANEEMKVKLQDMASLKAKSDRKIEELTSEIMTSQSNLADVKIEL
jgi:hypothetical protein